MIILQKAPRQFLFALISLFILATNAKAQDGRGNDTSYYVYYPGSITGRLFTCQKYTRFTVKNNGTRDLRYQPNTTFNLGVGATYHNFTLNLAYGFGFLNPEQQKGKTKYLDFQGHFYMPKWITDFDGQLYKGYHLYPKGFGTSGGNYYYRGDMKVNLFGISQYRIFNFKRFSYRASFIQNEWQKKSAGTFLAGVEAYYGVVTGDSNLIPQQQLPSFGNAAIEKINYFSIGPGIGYAYTVVLLHHLFVTGSLTGDAAFTFSNDHSGARAASHFSVDPVTRFHVAAGYNSRSWNISANWIEDNLPFPGTDKKMGYQFNTGNYRIVVAKRFNPGPRLKKHLRLFNFFKE